MAGSDCADYCNDYKSQKFYQVICIDTPPKYEKDTTAGGLALLKITPIFKFIKFKTIKKIDIVLENEVENVDESIYAYIKCYSSRYLLIFFPDSSCKYSENDIFIRYLPKTEILTNDFNLTLGAPLIIENAKNQSMVKGILISVECDEQNKRWLLKFLNMNEASLRRWINVTLNTRKPN